MFRTIIAIAGLVAVAGSTPEISGVSPNTLQPSDQAQILMVTGKDFSSGLSVELRTPDAQTRSVTGGSVTFHSATAFDVPLVLDRPGQYSLKVTNIDGGVTAPFAFQVKAKAAETTAPAQGPLLAIDRVSPETPVRSDQSQVLHLEGRGFENGVRVIVTDPAGADLTNVTVGKVTPNALDVTVLLSQRGPYVIVASNNAGATSNRMTVMVR